MFSLQVMVCVLVSGLSTMRGSGGPLFEPKPQAGCQDAEQARPYPTAFEPAPFWLLKTGDRTVFCFQSVSSPLRGLALTSPLQLHKVVRG